jgi:cysteine desulfurase
MYGGHAERDRRAGTENVAGIVGFGKACELARTHLEKNIVRVSALRDRFEQGLLQRVADSSVNCAATARTPNTSNMLFRGLDSESLVIALDLHGIACSAGAACSSGAVDASHVLAAIGLSQAEVRACIRFSLGPSNTEEEIDFALQVIPSVIAAHRSANESLKAAAR